MVKNRHQLLSIELGVFNISLYLLVTLVVYKPLKIRAQIWACAPCRAPIGKSARAQALCLFLVVDVYMFDNTILISMTIDLSM